VSRPAREREFSDDFLEGSCDDASDDAKARWDHLWSRVLCRVVAMQEVKKGILAHRSEDAAEFVPTLWKHVGMAMEAMAMLVMDKCLRQCGAEHTKEQQAVEATGVPVKDPKRVQGKGSLSGDGEEPDGTSSSVFCTRGSRWPGQPME
jgi:hypothetical protein